MFIIPGYKHGIMNIHKNLQNSHFMD
jgi:hypothetical protein